MLVPFFGFSQNYAPKDYYLVDSLNLDALTKTDRKLIDSCLNIYHTGKNQISKVDALGIICEDMIDENWEKYQQIQYQLIKRILASNPNKDNIKSLYISLAIALNNFGAIYYKQGNVPLALNSYNKGLKIEQEINDKAGMATSYNNIGLIHHSQGDFQLALNYY